MNKNNNNTIENFYSDLEIDVSQFFPNVPEEYQIKEKSDSKSMNILLLGSYRPRISKLIGMYEKGHPKPNEKLKDGKSLFPSERMVMVKKVLEQLGHKIMLGDRDGRDIRNVWNRLTYLMKKADHIVVLLNNQGGVLVEHAIITEKGYSNKTHNYFKEGGRLSRLLYQGSFFLPQTKIIFYKNDRNLADLIIRATETYQTNYYKNHKK